MVRIQEIIDVIETFAPLSYQESYDNAGLLVGDPTKKIKKALLTLDCTEAIVDEAIAKNCSLIIAHHPIIFKGLTSITGKNYVERVIVKAIKKDIAIYACHTNLDNVLDGVNAKFASKLGLQNLRILRPQTNNLKKLYTYAPLSEAENIRQALYQVGAGTIGNYEQCSFNTIGLGTFKANKDAKPFIGSLDALHEEKEVKIEVVYPTFIEKALVKALHQAHPYEEIAFGLVEIGNANKHIGAGMIGELDKPMTEVNFLKHVKSRMKTTTIRHTALLDKPIQKVALCGGAGSFLTNDAKKAGADAYISSDFKYHEFFDAEAQLLIADIGHFESEQYTNEIFFELLSKKFPNFAFLLNTVNTNPVNYF